MFDSTLAALPAVVYIPPANFAEFLDRYPKLIPNIIAGRWSGVAVADRPDLEQDVYGHLMTLPAHSIHRERGCIDRVATFFMTEGKTEQHFIGYIRGIVDHFIMNRHRSLRMTRATVRVADIAPSEQAGASDDSLWAVLGCVESTDPDAGLRFEEFLNEAFEIHPILAYVGVHLAVADTKREVCAAFGLSEMKMTYIIRHLRMLKKGDLAGARRFRYRKPYAPRAKGAQQCR